MAGSDENVLLTDDCCIEVETIRFDVGSMDV